MLDWVTDNAVALGVCLGVLTLAVSVAALAVSAWRYVAVRRAEQRQQRYLNYHKLVSELVDPIQRGTGKLDSQIAVVYELRFYREYGDLTKRMLRRLSSDWKDKEQPLIEEITLTVKELGG